MVPWAAAGVVARHKTEIFEAVDRRMHENGISRQHRSTHHPLTEPTAATRPWQRDRVTFAGTIVHISNQRIGGFVT
jgi:hypothetical protein